MGERYAAQAGSGFSVVVDSMTGVDVAQIDNEFTPAGLSGDVMVRVGSDETIGNDIATGEQLWSVDVAGIPILTPTQAVIVADDGTSVVVDSATGESGVGAAFATIPSRVSSEEDPVGITCGMVPMRRGRPLCTDGYLVQDDRIVELATGNDVTPQDCDHVAVFQGAGVCIQLSSSRSTISLVDLETGTELAVAPLAAGPDDRVHVSAGIDHIAVTIERISGARIGDLVLFAASV